MARCPRCGSEAIEEINYNTYKCHECGYMIRNPDDLDLADEEYGYWFWFLINFFNFYLIFIFFFSFFLFYFFIFIVL